MTTIETIEYRNIVKHSWPRGEWDNEPDKVQYTDPETGLPCLVRRNYFNGSLCGYVGVPEGHPYYGLPAEKVEDVLSVHGGVNFADGCDDDVDDPALSICHIAPDGGPVWWFGFDCGHSFDFAPGMYRFRAMQEFHDKFDKMLAPQFRSTYKNFAYVCQENADLARQLKELAA